MKGWTVCERRGAPVYRLPDNLPKEEIIVEDLTVAENRITDLHGLLDGMRLLIPTLFGWLDAKVVAHTDEGCTADSGDSWWFLDYDEEQGCWITTGGINKKAVDVLKDVREDR